MKMTRSPLLFVIRSLVVSVACDTGSKAAAAVYQGNGDTQLKPYL